MKTIAVLIVLLLTATTAFAFPAQPWGSNPDICKVQIANADGSVVGVYTWFNNATQMWEVKAGVQTYRDNVMVPLVWKGDINGLVEIDLSQTSRGYY